MSNNNKIFIEKINMDNLSLLEFRQLYFSNSLPVIITNIFNYIPSLSKWTPNYLIAKLKNKIIRVNTSIDGVFSINPKTGKFTSPPIEIGFRDYINRIYDQKTVEKLYMQQVSIIKALPELKDYFEIPKYIDSKKIQEINLWVGPGGNTSPLHYDLSNNFFIQLYGSKKFLLYSPAEFYNLYPNSCFSQTPHISKILIDSNTNNYPKLQKVKPIEIIISPGEMLFLPAYWWHQVYSIDTTISVNIWCTPLLKQHFVVGVFHTLLHHSYYLLKSLISK